MCSFGYFYCLYRLGVGCCLDRSRCGRIFVFDIYFGVYRGCCCKFWIFGYSGDLFVLGKYKKLNCNLYEDFNLKIVIYFFFVR